MSKKVNVGDVVGHLTIVEINDKETVVMCRCVCSDELHKYPFSMLVNHRMSCGCRGQKHDRKHKLYGVWSRMTANHGRRVCREWRTSYDSFADDVLPKFIEGGFFQRIDRLKPFDSSNVEFTKKRGKSNQNKHIKYNGESKSLKEWAVSTGLARETLYRRLKDGWSVEKTLTTPRRQGQP